MSDQWEMCYFNGIELYFWYPGLYEKRMSVDEYFDERRLIGGYENVVTDLLLDGWEPYASADKSKLFFKRKVRSQPMTLNSE